MTDRFPMRVQKYLSRCGEGSRRACDRLVESGRVKINGKTVLIPGTQVEEKDEVTLDDRPVRLKTMSYYLLDKPADTVCVNLDSRGRKYVIDLIPGGRELGLFPVGRLDMDTTGLMIITNDGELGNRIAHPRYGIGKTYEARIKGEWGLQDLKERIEGSIEIYGGGTVEGAIVLSASIDDGTTVVNLRIHEGRKHVVKRIFKAIGSMVRELRRISIGDLSVDHLNGKMFIKVDRDLLEELILSTRMIEDP